MQSKRSALERLERLRAGADGGGLHVAVADQLGDALLLRPRRPPPPAAA